MGGHTKKKTGLVGPASSASSWMRLHHSAARLALRGCIYAPQADHRSKDLARQAETDFRLDASGLPCIHLFRFGPQQIVFIVVMEQWNLDHLWVIAKLAAISEQSFA